MKERTSLITFGLVESCKAKQHTLKLFVLGKVLQTETCNIIVLLLFQVMMMFAGLVHKRHLNYVTAKLSSRHPSATTHHQGKKIMVGQV